VGDDTLVAMHAIVRGRVQGVGFRATTCEHARELHLVGSVRNCRDGSVEIYAQGKRSDLEQLLWLLQKQHQIKSIATNFDLPLSSYLEFDILY
jgi:acylphosphatase